MIFVITMAAITIVTIAIGGWSCWETLRRERKARKDEDMMRLITKWHRISAIGKSDEKPKEFETKTT